MDMNLSLISSFLSRNIGEQSTHTLKSLAAKLGNPSSDFNTRTNAELFKCPHAASAYTAQIAITAAGGNQALGAITVAGIPAGATVARVFMHVKFGGRENTNAAVNSISGAQNIQAKNNAGAYKTGIALAGGEYATVASSGVVSGDVILATAELVAAGMTAPVNGDVITFQWTSAKAAQNNLNINDIQVILELWWSH